MDNNSSSAETIINALERENYQLKQKVSVLGNFIDRSDDIIEQVNLSGINSKQKKLLKKYFQERKKIQ